jgi:hypothetical protein
MNGEDAAGPTSAGFLGLLMLDTRFPRPPGDVGNALTWQRAGIPVHMLRVRGATPRRVLAAASGRSARGEAGMAAADPANDSDTADGAWLRPFVDAARRLEAEGARLISTSCGFLAAGQAALQAAVQVPVLSSSLLQVARCPRPGILTIDAASLDVDLLAAAGVPAGTPVQGVAPGCEFQRRILGNETTMDLAQAERDVVAGALALVQAWPGLQSIVLECTNMPPYRAAVAQATGLPVLDIETLLITRWRSLAGDEAGLGTGGFS